jgi:hypothetical protein
VSLLDLRSLEEAASGAVTFVYAGSGGIVFGGSGTYTETWAYAASGGIVFGGTGTVKVAHTYAVVSGGLTFGGAASYKDIHAYAATGGIGFGGASTNSKTHVAWYGTDPFSTAHDGSGFGFSNGRFSQESFGATTRLYDPLVDGPTEDYIGELGDPNVTPIPTGTWRLRINCVSVPIGQDTVTVDVILNRRNEAGTIIVQQTVGSATFGPGITNFVYTGVSWAAGSATDRISFRWIVTSALGQYTLNHGGTDGTGLYAPWGAYVATTSAAGVPSGVVFAGAATYVQVPQRFSYQAESNTFTGDLEFGGTATISTGTSVVEDSRGFIHRRHAHTRVESTTPIIVRATISREVRSDAVARIIGSSIQVAVGTVASVYSDVSIAAISTVVGTRVRIASGVVPVRSDSRIEAVSTSILVQTEPVLVMASTVIPIRGYQVRTRIGRVTVEIGPDLVQAEEDELIFLLEVA